jgi:hypothetical protein
MNGDELDIDISKLKENLNEEQVKAIDTLLATISLQAEIIQDLYIDLSFAHGADRYREKILSGISLTQLAAQLEHPVVKGPTLEEINAEIKTMQERIKSAASAQETLGTILKFALKVAPLII